ncbi:hypothetical protein EBB07_00920 [Paenibacillaceae bacterium]|nr:hypothetical protein EBB07_00920 [Paenibacillaceae bacterium]
MFFFFFFEIEEIQPGTVCRVKEGVWRRTPGLLVVVENKAGENSYWAYENRPVRHRINRKGDRVLDFDPACCQTIYSHDDLEVTNEIPLQVDGWGAEYRWKRLR